jgi:hypothetical protein
MRYWICDISGPGPESRFEIDLEEPPAEGSLFAPGRLSYKISAIVRLPGESSPGVIEVEQVAEPPLAAIAGASYGLTTDPH